MASSNVEYYEKQKELQDSILENEQKRKRLEAQLQAYSRSDDKLAKLRAVKLQSYWKRICEDEKKSKLRNAQLLRSMDRMEANMASLDARREKLKHMKEQYFDYIERTYPKWLELVQQQKQESQQQQQHQQQQQQYQQQQQQFQQQQQQYQQQQPYQQQYQQQQRRQQKQNQLPSQQYNGTINDPRTEYGMPPTSTLETIPKQQEGYIEQVHVENHRNMYQDDESSEDTPPPLPRQPPPPVAFRGPEREYANISGIRRDAQAASASQPQSVTVRIPGQGDHGEGNTRAQSGRPDSGRMMEQPNQNWMTAERDASTHSVSFSEEVEVPIQPIQSVTVRQKTDQPAQPPPQRFGSVSDDDVSDFGSEPDLPSGADMQHNVNTAVKPPSPLPVDDDDDDTDQSPSMVHPGLSTSGLYRLMKFVEEELLNALALEGFYRSSNPPESTKKDIIYKANNSGSTLATLDGELVSMVILQQLTLVLRRLPGGCMLSDTLLSKGVKSLTEGVIRANLHRDAQSLWDRLLEHFILLVKNRVMGTREVAHVFVPCLVHEGSEYQGTAVSVIETVTENAIEKTNGRTSPVQDSVTVDTVRSSQQGGDHYMNVNLAVPPLMFGSLVDSKPFSDEESSMITQSMNTDVQRVPLNETDAYKSLVSGSNRAVRQVSHDDTDNSDNELEKQIASTLSPRSHGSKPNIDPYNEAPSSAPKDESHDLSHDQEPESEVSSQIAPPVYVPTGADPSTIKSVLGSTGGSSQQRKLVGLISSDLDSDADVDIDHMVQKKDDDDDDDDFHDFYQ